MEDYKALKATVQAAPKGERSIVKKHMEYLKPNEIIGPPNYLIELLFRALLINLKNEDWKIKC